MQKLEVLLIRHGETDLNREGRFAGTTDTGLNKTGKKQIKNLRKKLKNENIEMIYSSNLKRCIETVKILNLKAGVNYSNKLQEMNFGRWEKLNFKEIEMNYRNEVEKWKTDWINYVIPKGESFAEMSKRVIDEFERIKKNYTGSRIAIITHGGCVRTILGHYVVNSVKDSWKFFISNGSLSRLSFDDNYVYLKSLNE
ncbi:MAG: alpha-ribazole phosphatase [Spirochaetes bacterium]|nr:alpha-ribazole phosphatase [Spirochaetota bacterium]